MPAIEAAFPRWIAIPRDWNKNDVDLLSPVDSSILDPIALMNFKAIGAHAPNVSAATGVTNY